jgi:ABC-type cobalamin/Fe3+-siderophores transport system ATPase subunit
MYIKSLNIKKYKILENIQIDFTIPDGENAVNIIAGVNGSGKTTLLKWILSIFDPNTSSSSYNLNGFAIRDDDIKIAEATILMPMLWSNNYQHI